MRRLRVRAGRESPAGSDRRAPQTSGRAVRYSSPCRKVSAGKGRLSTRHLRIALPRPRERGVRCFRSAVRIVLHAGGTDMKLPRRKFLRLAAGATALPSVSRIARAQDRLSRPVRIVVGFTAGSATDITARLFAQKLNEAWKTPVTVENVPGAGGSVGAERVAKSAPDGSTLYWGANGAMTINPSLQPSPAFDPARDLAPIARVLVMPSILAVNNEVPAKNVAELFALAKAQPGKLSYATPGAGTPQHIAGELLKSLAGVDIVHVPYRGAVFTDVISGRVTMTLMNMGAILPLV